MTHVTLAERVRESEREVTQVNVRLAVDLKQRLVDLAESEGISLTDLIRVACEDALAKYEVQPPIPRRRR